jgi:hypothetical protein
MKMNKIEINKYIHYFEDPKNPVNALNIPVCVSYFLISASAFCS